jgi:hypothetical protein
MPFLLLRIRKPQTSEGKSEPYTVRSSFRHGVRCSAVITPFRVRTLPNRSRTVAHGQQVTQVSLCASYSASIDDPKVNIQHFKTTARKLINRLAHTLCKSIMLLVRRLSIQNMLHWKQEQTTLLFLLFRQARIISKKCFNGIQQSGHILDWAFNHLYNDIRQSGHILGWAFSHLYNDTRQSGHILGRAFSHLYTDIRQSGHILHRVFNHLYNEPLARPTAASCPLAIILVRYEPRCKSPKFFFRQLCKCMFSHGRTISTGMKITFWGLRTHLIFYLSSIIFCLKNNRT